MIQLTGLGPGRAKCLTPRSTIPRLASRRTRRPQKLGFGRHRSKAESGRISGQFAPLMCVRDVGEQSWLEARLPAFPRTTGSLPLQGEEVQAVVAKPEPGTNTCKNSNGVKRGRDGSSCAARLLSVVCRVTALDQRITSKAACAIR